MHEQQSSATRDYLRKVYEILAPYGIAYIGCRLNPNQPTEVQINGEDVAGCGGRYKEIKPHQIILNALYGNLRPIGRRPIYHCGPMEDQETRLRKVFEEHPDAAESVMIARNVYLTKST